MSKDRKKKQKSENSKITKEINTIWVIDYYNTSDIGYPDEEYYTQVEKED